MKNYHPGLTNRFLDSITGRGISIQGMEPRRAMGMAMANTANICIRTREAGKRSNQESNSIKGDTRMVKKFPGSGNNQRLQGITHLGFSWLCVFHHKVLKTCFWLLKSSEQNSRNCGAIYLISGLLEALYILLKAL